MFSLYVFSCPTCGFDQCWNVSNSAELTLKGRFNLWYMMIQNQTNLQRGSGKRKIYQYQWMPHSNLKNVCIIVLRSFSKDLLYLLKLQYDGKVLKCLLLRTHKPFKPTALQVITWQSKSSIIAPTIPHKTSNFHRQKCICQCILYQRKHGITDLMLFCWVKGAPDVRSHLTLSLTPSC